MNTSIISTALQSSLFLGIHSELPWFTSIQQQALAELHLIEQEYERSKLGLHIDSSQSPKHQTVKLASESHQVCSDKDCSCKGQKQASTSVSEPMGIPVEMAVGQTCSIDGGCSS